MEPPVSGMLRMKLPETSEVGDEEEYHSNGRRAQLIKSGGTIFVF